MRYRDLQGSILILTMIVVTACSTVYSGTEGLSSPGKYNRITGNYTQEFSASLDKTWEATLEALNALELTIYLRSKDQLGGRMEAKRADGTDVDVSLTPRGPALTVVVIGLGRKDKNAVIRISQELERRLKR